MKAKLVLEDGRVFNGDSFGATGERYGEVVFNTSLSGYQEIITDPSYSGQIVAMTYPLIGNYGINTQDCESRKPFLEGFVVKEVSRIASNWRSEKTLTQYFKENNILGIQGIDTRALTRHIRLAGAMKAVISTDDLDNASLTAKAKNSLGLVGCDLVAKVTTAKNYQYNQTGQYKVVVLDCGVKTNILRCLSQHDCRVVVLPYSVSAQEIRDFNPDGILLSNGPGDPAAVKYVTKTIQALYREYPIMGICLGHQLLGLALGGKTYKLKFGHHGGNHPVKDLRQGTIGITSQNHGFCVDLKSLSANEIELTHINLNDNTVEGFRHKHLPIFSVQFHPESAPGPHDTQYLFGQFIQLMQKNKKTNAKTH